MIKCNVGECINEKVKFEGCCAICPDKEGCEDACDKTPETCGDATEGETAIAVFQTEAAAIMSGIVDVVRLKAKIEKDEKDLRAKLETAMNEHGIRRIDNDILRITHIAPSTSTGVDNAKLKATYPHIYNECCKISNKKGYIKIELKGAKK